MPSNRFLISSCKMYPIQKEKLLEANLEAFDFRKKTKHFGFSIFYIFIILSSSSAAAAAISLPARLINSSSTLLSFLFLRSSPAFLRASISLSIGSAGAYLFSRPLCWLYLSIIFIFNLLKEWRSWLRHSYIFVVAMIYMLYFYAAFLNTLFDFSKHSIYFF